MSGILFSLSGKVALVTGAAQGIGRGIALALAEAGADVVVNDLPGNVKTGVLAEDVRALGRRVLVAEADVTREAEVEGMFDRAEHEFGCLDILINNAGTTRSQDIFETGLDDWDRILCTNLTSAFLCARRAMAIMREHGGGRIVNISSVVGERGALHGHVHYAATKSGLLGMTKTLARTGAPHGITVNAVAPGIIETDLLYKTHGAQEVDRLAAEVPMGLGATRDVGLAAVYLCSEGGRYITGATLDVNGGAYLR